MRFIISAHFIRFFTKEKKKYLALLITLVFILFISLMNGNIKIFHIFAIHTFAFTPRYEKVFRNKICILDSLLIREGKMSINEK